MGVTHAEASHDLRAAGTASGRKVSRWLISICGRGARVGLLVGRVSCAACALSMGWCGLVRLGARARG
eukprot:5282112-Prymnesium_polylepis.1